MMTIHLYSRAKVRDYLVILYENTPEHSLFIEYLMYIVNMKKHEFKT